MRLTRQALQRIRHRHVGYRITLLTQMALLLPLPPVATGQGPVLTAEPALMAVSFGLPTPVGTGLLSPVHRRIL